MSETTNIQKETVVNAELSEGNITPIKNNNIILENFKNEFASSVIPVYVNSLGKEVNFREVTVKEQKALSKTMIQNESRKDIVYDTQCALINQVCLDKDFDIYSVTEFDRIRILMEIYSSNYFQDTITYKCPECGQENSYVLPFEKIIGKFNAFDLKDVKYTMEDRTRVYNFTLNYPCVRAVSNFYKNYMKKYRNLSQNERKILDDLGNIEYINLFITKVEIISKRNPNDRKEADLKLMSYDDVETLLSYFPQNIMFDEEKGVLKHIANEFITKINGIFQYEKCAHCGYETKEGMGNLIDFF